MLNQIVLVGRVSKEIEDVAKKDGKKQVRLILEVPRSYKNSEGSYDTDYIRCILRNGIAENIVKYCEVGSTVGVKGRVETTMTENKGKVDITMNVVAERVTFLSGKS